jgi:DNA-binding transcriptional MerR regulator
MATPDKDLQNLPVMKAREALDFVAARRSEGKPDAKALLAEADFIELMEALSGFDLTARLLHTYSSPRVGLLPPPVRKDGRACYIYPDQVETVGLVLVLRKGYHLPLGAIRDLVKHIPADRRHLVLERKLTIEELLELSKVLPRGFAVEDLIMAKTCDLMVEDTLSPAKALLAATEPGDVLRKTEEAAILGRLDQLRDWVASGRRQKFVAREAAEDFRDLARNKRAAAKIVKKLMARRARGARR